MNEYVRDPSGQRIGRKVNSIGVELLMEHLIREERRLRKLLKSNRKAQDLLESIAEGA